MQEENPTWKGSSQRDPRAGEAWDAVGILLAQLGKSSLLKDNHSEELLSITPLAFFRQLS